MSQSYESVAMFWLLIKGLFVRTINSDKQKNNWNETYWWSVLTYQITSNNENTDNKQIPILKFDTPPHS